MSDSDTVLVVEDNPDLQYLLEYNFQTRGFDVVVAEDGADALEYLQGPDELPDVIVLDLMMPAVNGVEFLHRRADSPDLQAVPVLVLTAVDDEETLAEAYDLGVEDYVTKPFSPSALVTRVKHLQ